MTCRRTVLLLFVLFASAARAENARDAEARFAKAFADRDAATFFSFVADDATFIGRTRTLRGKAAVVEGWTPYLKDAPPPFSWRPEHVETNGAGDLALSTGPVFDKDGKHVADFYSVWRKTVDGSWKIIFDGPGAQLCPGRE